MKLSVIIPVFNEEVTIEEVIERVLQVPFDKEVIIVDDGSRDQTSLIVQRVHQENLDIVKVFTSPINFGKGAAIRIGLQFITGDIVIIQDADLELDPKEYVNLVTPIMEGKASVVYGSRFLRKNAYISLKTRLANRALATLANMLYGTRLTDEGTAYKVFRADIIKSIPLSCLRFEFCPEVTAKLSLLGHKIHEVPVDFNPRTKIAGKKLNYLKDGTQAVATLFKYRFWRNVKRSVEKAPDVQELQ